MVQPSMLARVLCRLRQTFCRHRALRFRAATAMWPLGHGEWVLGVKAVCPECGWRVEGKVTAAVGTRVPGERDLLSIPSRAALRVVDGGGEP